MAQDDVGFIKLRDAARRRERDFISLFNALWYRDFPFIRGHEPNAVRAMYTAHINSIVKGCADLMGFFTLFEEGKRTDAIIQKADDTRTHWAKIELEWAQPFREKVNELKKLSTAAEAKQADVFIFIGYSENKRLADNISVIESQWPHSERHLLVFLITFDIVSDKRKFTTLQTYRVASGAAKKLREQYALPWDVPDTRWKASAA